MPTETVYGLAADATSDRAVAAIYAAKERPAINPLIAHVLDIDEGREHAIFGPEAETLARAFWPGPLTLVVTRNPAGVAAEVTGGRDTVGIRVPDHPVALELLERFGGGVAAPSANRFGRVSPTTAEHVRADLGSDVQVVLDGGPSRVGVESTIVAVTGVTPVILRLGGVGRAQVERVLGRACAVSTAGEHAAPGTLASHYAPRAHVEIVDAPDAGARAREIASGGRRVGLLAMELSGCRVPEGVMVLTPPSDIAEYARVLYSRLREADEHRLDVLLVVLPGGAGNSDTGGDTGGDVDGDSDALAAAIADRVCRASH